MKSKVILAGFLIVSAIILVGAWIGVPQVLGSSSKYIAPAASDVSASRWQALGEAYSSRQGMWKMAPADISTARALSISEAKPVLSAGDISALRWQALGEAYSARQGTWTMAPADISAARWQALGEAYLQRGTFMQEPAFEFKGNR